MSEPLQCHFDTGSHLVAMAFSIFIASTRFRIGIRAAADHWQEDRIGILGFLNQSLPGRPNRRSLH